MNLNINLVTKRRGRAVCPRLRFHPPLGRFVPAIDIIELGSFAFSATLPRLQTKDAVQTPWRIIGPAMTRRAHESRERPARRPSRAGPLGTGRRSVSSPGAPESPTARHKGTAVQGRALAPAKPGGPTTVVRESRRERAPKACSGAPQGHSPGDFASARSESELAGS
jgi:hypothetical protein